MNCADVHLHLGAEPGVTNEEIEAHLRQCPECARYQREMIRLDEQIRRALLIEPSVIEAASVPGVSAQSGVPHEAMSPSGVVRQSRYSSRFREWALAASLLVALGIFFVMWGAVPRHTLAADVVSHVISEEIGDPLNREVEERLVSEVMERSGLRLDPINPRIVFIRTCLLRGRWVPHFVVRTEQGTATVMIMPHEQLKAPERFDSSGYKGLLLPDPHKGTVAVLSRKDFDMERYAGEIRRAVHPLPREDSGSKRVLIGARTRTEID